MDTLVEHQTKASKQGIRNPDAVWMATPLLKPKLTIADEVCEYSYTTNLDMRRSLPNSIPHSEADLSIAIS